jgi:hypothetical protein
MNQRTLASLLLAGSLLARPAAAQNTTDTRAGEVSSARDIKAATLTVAAADKVERLLDFVERNSLMQQLSTPRDGLGIRFGGIERGSGLAAGPVWRTSSPLQGRLQLRASAAASIARDHEIEGEASIHEVGTHRISVSFGASASHLAQERFFGEGPSSSRVDETAFALDRRAAGVDATVTGASWLRVTAGAGFAGLTVADGAARGVPGILTRWTADGAPGLDSATTFSVVSVSATADWRDVPGNPRHGGRYHVRLERHSDRSLKRHSFNRMNVELEQHLPWWRNQRMVTLRGMAVLSQPDSGHEVPFYLQPTLGGSHVLLGFVTDRFRDRNALALQAEYAWDIWPFLNAVLFYETVAVAHEWQEIAFKNLKRDYGIGFRFGSARTIALRTDVALGSGEGTRIAMRFSHAF